MTSRLDDHNMLCGGGGETQAVEPPGAVTPELIARFWRNVAKNANGGCWLWKGALDRLGYGQLTWQGKPRRAHRVAYLCCTGKWFPADVKLRHSCDVRNCCNPAHLLPGTQADNMRDRKLREGYRTMAKGERHARAKLTEASVRAIRAADASGGLRPIARHYGVSEPTVTKIRSRQAWAWLD